MNISVAHSQWSKLHSRLTASQGSCIYTDAPHRVNKRRKVSASQNLTEYTHVHMCRSIVSFKKDKTSFAESLG